MTDGRIDYTQRRRRFSFILLLAVALFGYTAFSQIQASQLNDSVERSPITNEAIEADDSLVLATEAIEELPVRERASRDGYSRSHFSSGWARVEGCDMRNRILQRDLEEVVLDDDNCTVLSGVLRNDPFTGTTIPFTRGRGSSNDIHIEHLVAVSDAWQKGAQALEPEQRHEFYNDPLNLLAVEGAANMEKGDADASQWLPVKEYRCRYVARQIAVKLKHLLWVTRAEYNAMRQVLRTCPLQVLPIEEAADVAS